MAFGTDYTPVGPMPTDIVLGDVDATSMRLARDIRDKGHGIDTRETMARMMLKSSTMHNHLIKVNNALKVQNDEYYRQFTDVMKELSEDKDYHSLPEIASARDGFDTLGERLKSEVFDMSRMGQDVKEAMTGGSVAVVGKNTILEENIVDKQVTAEKTNFAKPYKNLFNGVYTTGIVGGNASEGFNYYTSVAGKSIVLTIEPNMTYTISWSADTNRFGVATFGSEPSDRIPVKRLINHQENVIPTITFTADSTDRFLVIYLSTESEYREPTWLQIEKGNVATPFVAYGKLDIDVAIKNNNIVEPIKKENIEDGAISAQKTNFAKRYRNLFDGKYVEDVIIGGDSTSGYKFVNISGGVSLVMEIEPNQTYTISRSLDTNRFGIGVFEGEPSIGTEVKRLLNHSQSASSGTFTFTAGVTETYLVVYLSSENEIPSWVQIEKGAISTNFVGYDKLDIDVAIRNDNIVEPIKIENTTVVEKYNLLNKEDFNDEKLLNGTGGLVDFQNYSTSTIQFINKGRYFVSAHRRLVTFTMNGAFIKEYDNSGHDDITIDIPEDCIYQISCRDEHWDDLRVVRKDYGQLSDDTLLLASDIFIPQNSQNGHSQRFVDKNIIFFGDSVMKNYPENQTIPDLVGERLGCNVTNVAIGGTKLVYVEDDNNTPLSGSRLLEAKINNDLSEQFTRADTQSGLTKERTLSSLNALNDNNLNFYDFAVIAYTTNDFLQSMPEGDFDKDRATIKGSFSYFIENLLTASPSTKLLLVSPAYQWRPNDLSYDIDEQINGAGLKLADIVRIIKEVADHYKLEFLDNFNNAGINEFNRQYYYPSNDGIHPLVSTGIPLLANRIAGKLEDVF